jgi:predicted DNA-binding transcriptional regulator AlpA/DNA-binding XRE family transcriptional regulator
MVNNTTVKRDLVDGVPVEKDLKWFTVPYLCKLLRLSKKQVYELKNRDFIPAAKAGGRLLFLDEDVHALITSDLLRHYRKDPRFVTPKKAAQILGLGESTVYAHMNSNRLPHVEVRGKKLLPEGEVRKKVGTFSSLKKSRGKSEVTPASSAPVEKKPKSPRKPLPEVLPYPVGSELVMCYLEASRLSAEDLAKRVGCHRRDISQTKYGSGRVSRPMQRKIAAYFRLEVADMYNARGVSYTRV